MAEEEKLKRQLVKEMEKEVNKKIQQDGYDLNEITEQIRSAGKNIKQDKFKTKYAFIVCNEKFKEKTGLIDLP